MSADGMRKTPVALPLTGATELCYLVARMSVAQSGRPGGVSLTPVLVASKIPGGAVAYRGYSAVRFGSPDERSAIREAGWRIADTGAGGFKNPRWRCRLPGLQRCAIW